MKAMILAAGRGKRMMPLTANEAKPLLSVWGRPMIEWQILRLKQAGIREFVINTAHCSDHFFPVLGDGSKYGVQIEYSVEGALATCALETRGGVIQALEKLDSDRQNTPFILVAGDVVTNYDYSRLVQRALEMKHEETVAHLVLVPNPEFHLQGDMTVKEGLIVREPKHTYSCLGVFKPSIFYEATPGVSPLFPWLYEYVERKLVSGEITNAQWANIGSPSSLATFNALAPFKGFIGDT